jgi:hypothetical protein
VSLRTVACAALVAFGLAHPVGWLTGLGTWRDLGLHFLVSPLPLVFNKSGPVETYARRFSLALDGVSGGRFEMRGDPGFSSRLRGPFTRKKIYLELFLYWDTWESPAPALLHAFCRPEPLSRELGVEEPVGSVTVEIRSVFARPDWHRVLTTSCPP